MSVIYIAILFVLFLATGLLATQFLPDTKTRFLNIVERLLYALFAGISLQVLLLIVENAVFRISIGVPQVVANCAVLLFAFLVARRRLGWSAFSLVGQWGGIRDLVALLAVAIVFAAALGLRLTNTLEYPDLLLDADPYRHLVRVRAMAEGMTLLRWDPLIYGKIPIFQLQGAYVLGALVIQASGIEPLYVWKYLPIAIGACSSLTIYLLGQGIFRNRLVGVGAGLFLATCPIHITRTNIGFISPFALAFVPLVMVHYLWFARQKKLEHALLMGLFFSAVSCFNLVEGFWLVPLLALHGLAVVALTGERFKFVGGCALGAALFFALVMLWWATYLGVTPWLGASSVAAATSESTRNLAEPTSLPHLTKQYFAWLDPASVGLAVLGLYFMIAKRKEPSQPDQAQGSASGMLTLLFLVLISCIYLPLGYLFLHGYLPTFVVAPYRYFILASFGVSLLAAKGCASFVEAGWEIVGSWWLAGRKLRESRRDAVITATTLVVVAALVTGSAFSRTLDRWKLSFGPDELKALEWLKENTPPDSLVVAEWYEADFIRSYASRGVVLATEPHPEARLAIQKTGLDLKVLSTDAEIIDFARTASRKIYVFKNLRGPFGPFASRSEFKTVFRAGEGTEEITIYEVLTDDVPVS